MVAVVAAAEVAVEAVEAVAAEEAVAAAEEAPDPVPSQDSVVDPTD